MRTFLYLALVGAASLLLLLPLRGAFASVPAWAAAPQAVMAREGRYDQRLRPGESRTYVLELASRSLVEIRFRGAGEDLGLRVEDVAGLLVGPAGLDVPAAAQERRLGVANPAGTAQTLYLTVFRSGPPTPRRPLGRDAARGGRTDGAVLDAAGAYALELTRGTMP